MDRSNGQDRNWEYSDLNFASKFWAKVIFPGAMPRKKRLRLYATPKGTTRYSQPWDNIGFRPWKHLVRSLSDRILTHHVDFKLQDRNNIILPQSVIYRQLCSPRFRTFFRYCWKRCGYLDDKPPGYVSPSKYCLEDNGSTCSCGLQTIMRCSWCTQSFCKDCMFIKQHNCNNLVDWIE